MELLAEGPWGLLLALTFGLCVGSFANVVIHRSPIDGLSSFRPARSFCPSCRAGLTALDNVPVLSWLLLRARCRHCGARISARYPAVELLVAILFVAAWWRFPPVDRAATVYLLACWYLAATCVIVSLIDLEHLIIPDSITYPGMLLGLVASTAFPSLQEGHVAFLAERPHGSALIASAAGIAAGAGSLLLVGQLGNLLFRKQVEAAGVADAMGLGDVKWMALAGAFLGFAKVLSAIMIACFAGALIGIMLKLIARMRGDEGVVGLPFGPFLAIGILCELAIPAGSWGRALMEALGPPS